MGGPLSCQRTPKETVLSQLMTLLNITDRFRARHGAKSPTDATESVSTAAWPKRTLAELQPTRPIGRHRTEILQISTLKTRQLFKLCELLTRNTDAGTMIWRG